MAQDFSNNIPSIAGHGAFGSQDDPDGAASMRYTEQRLSKFAEDVLLDGLSENVVDFTPNFDGRLKEPKVLPSKIPYVLLNGISGIATGFATWIPPHNLVELLNGCAAYLENRDISKTELLKYIPAPDFPTGGIINGTGGIPLMYNSGNGGFKLRGRLKSEQNKKGEWEVTIYEVPYGVKPSDILSQVIQLNELGIVKIVDALNMADRNNKVKIFIRFHKSEDDIKRIEGLLYSRTYLESKISANFLMLVDGSPTRVSLLEIIRHFVGFREEVLYKKHNAEKDKNLRRMHILEGLFKITNVIDDVIHIIRKSDSYDDACSKLMKKYSLSMEQTEYILRIPLMKLTRLEMNSSKDEYEKLKSRNLELDKLLKNNGSNKDVDKYLISEWEEIKKKYGTKRKTEIRQSVEAVDTTRLVKSTPCMIISTKNGYIKRLPLTQADMVQGRGGKGRNIPGIDMDDEVKEIIDCTTTTELTLVTSAGKVYNKLAYEIEEIKNGVGKRISSVFDLGKKEYPVLFTAFEDNIQRVLLVLANGDVKVSKITDLRGSLKIDVNGKSRAKKGTRLLKMEPSDKLVAAVGLTMKDGDEYAILASKNGKAMRLNVKEIRVSSPAAGGIKGMTLTGDDEITSACGARSEYITVVSSTGFAKRIETKSVRMISRGGKGVNIGSNSDDGDILYVGDKSEGLLTLTTSSNKMLTFDLETIRTTGKTSKGVKVANLGKDEYLTRVN